MSDARLDLCFGVHNHQPIGNLDRVLEEATARAYHPFLQRVRARSEVRLTVHCTGSLLEWLRERAAPTYDLLGSLAAGGQVELLTGGFYEPILSVLPDADKVGQIERLSRFLGREFGVRPRGMWLAERVWEPHLPRALREAGVEYVLVDDSHFALAGLDPESLDAYYLTEDQGGVLRVFPISQRLRYLIPFAAVDESLAYLESRRGSARAVTVVDDGEKFGAWPGTHAHVYEDGWLDRFIDRLLATPWLRLATLADVVDGMAPSGRVYLPTASYREMGEWALPVAAARELAVARRELAALPGGERLQGLLRGGFWRGFLVKYAEVADTYWKMLRLSAAVHGALARQPGEPRLQRARTALWRGQANDAYWHGVFGGCYLPHLRRAVKGALLESERLLAEAGAVPAPGAWCGDGNGDGSDEVLVRTRELSVTVAPARGGVLTELGYLPRAIDLADVLTRRPEAYHERLRAAAGEGGIPGTSAPEAETAPGLETLLRYDELRRASLIDALFAPEGSIDPVAPWAASRALLGRAAFDARVVDDDGGVTIHMTRVASDEDGVKVDKDLRVAGAHLTARYHVATGQAGRWGVQWNLALSAGDAPGRYLRWEAPGPPAEGWPSLASAGRLAGSEGITLVDEWVGVEAQLTCSPRAEVAWGPVETISVSEAGFERIYQGLALLLLWPLGGRDGEEMEVTLRVQPR